MQGKVMMLAKTCNEARERYICVEKLIGKQQAEQRDDLL